MKYEISRPNHRVNKLNNLWAQHYQQVFKTALLAAVDIVVMNALPNRTI